MSKAGTYKTQKYISKFNNALNLMSNIFNPLTVGLTASILPYTNMPMNSMLKTLQWMDLISHGVGGIQNARSFFNILHYNF